MCGHTFRPAGKIYDPIVCLFLPPRYVQRFWALSLLSQLELEHDKTKNGKTVKLIVFDDIVTPSYKLMGKNFLLYTLFCDRNLAFFRPLSVSSKAHFVFSCYFCRLSVSLP
uniref:Uncharacterized protein n=1 Tax=Cacopsylla melanoneura TaxID=428564 RepID=A0A8D9EGT9_9HEMI